MQCPRCLAEAPNGSPRCPACHKSFAQLAAGSVRVALTGEVHPGLAGETAPSPAAKTECVAADAAEPAARNGRAKFRRAPAGADFPADSDGVDEPDAAANEGENAPDVPDAPRLIPTRPGLFPVQRRITVPRRREAPQALLRWLIAALSFAGAVWAAYLCYRPYVAPVHFPVYNPGAAEFAPEEAARAIPAVYLWLWGGYCVLAVLSQLFQPGPWRIGGVGIRTNWVVNITTALTIVVFMGTSVGEGERRAFEREDLVNNANGTYTYRSGNETRPVDPPEAATIYTRLVRARESETYRYWNIAALVSFLALGGYAVWWNVARPEPAAPGPLFDPEQWLRQRAGQPDPATTVSDEAVPAENTRSREPSEENISWR
ncbi:MAG TPA: hypothetical protein VKT77_17110 [Chthonomonadaceae bacterium]|nr:hypothetical protein [Chthonomonadaceae bacterium]